MKLLTSKNTNFTQPYAVKGDAICCNRCPVGSTWVYLLQTKQAPSSWVRCSPSSCAPGSLIAIASLGWHLFKCQRKYQGLLHAWAPATRCSPGHGKLPCCRVRDGSGVAVVLLLWRGLCRAHKHVHVHNLLAQSPVMPCLEPLPPPRMWHQPHETLLVAEQCCAGRMFMPLDDLMTSCFDGLTIMYQT